MGRNPLMADSLVLVYKDALIELLFKVLKEERSDVPDTYHQKAAVELAESLIQPSF